MKEWVNVISSIPGPEERLNKFDLEKKLKY